jgi:hypothetical protein
MISKLQAFASLYRELGPRWTLFRLAYAFRLRTGLIRLQMPMGEWSDYKNQITITPVGRVERVFFPLVSRPHLTNAPWNSQTAIDEANRLLNGEIKYFSHDFTQAGFPPKWNHDYVTLSASASSPQGEESLLPQSEILRSAQNDMAKHWSQLSDDHVVARSPKGDEAISNYQGAASSKIKSASQRHYDIKFVWEPNRFAFTYTLVRAFTYSPDEKYPEAYWTLIEDWA